MTQIVTLVSPAGLDALDLATCDKVRAALAGAGADSGDIAWLAPDAADITCSLDVAKRKDAMAAARACLAGRPIDIAIQNAAGRRKRLFLADMDSTMIGQECIDELADYAGLKAHVAAITERAMRGEIEFAPALRERVALLKGLPVAVVAEVLDKRITLTPGGRELVRTMRAHGAYTCLVSGGFTLFTEQVAAQVGFDENRANTLIVEGEKFAGRVAEPILGREAKRATLRDLRARHGLEPDATLVVGDGANDLDMIGEAGLGVAYHAKPKVAEAAGARIDHCDLSALLYLQGYTREEFVAA